MGYHKNKTDSRMDIREILKYLPHRYPFLLVDRVVEYAPRQSLVAIKNVTFNEPFFSGHFPQQPVMPGVLIIEAIAQATGILALRSEEGPEQRKGLYYLASVDNVRFKRPVIPGDQLIMSVQYLRDKRGIWKFTGEASVDGELAAVADITAAFKDGLD
jgi:3-hydroxyacyl-[acyl-carrier-protein] dehydratase